MQRAPHPPCIQTRSPNPSSAGGPSRACAAVREADTHTHAHTCAHTHTWLPWLERMGWGREAEVGATLGGELLGLTQGAAASRESSLT